MNANTNVLQEAIANSNLSTSGESVKYFCTIGRSESKSDVSVKSDSGSDDSYKSIGIPSSEHDRNESQKVTTENRTSDVDEPASLEINTVKHGCSGRHASADSTSGSMKSQGRDDQQSNLHCDVCINMQNQITSNPEDEEPKLKPSNPKEEEPKTSHKRRNTLIKIVVTCVLIAAVVAGISQYNKVKTDSNINVWKTPEALTCVKSNQLALVSLGNQVCYSDFYVANSSKLVYLRMNLISSNYKPYEVSIFVNSSSDFVGKLGEWMVDYNTSRKDGLLRLIQQHVTCQSSGTYRLLLQYENGLNTTTEFEVRISDPKLEQIITYIDDKILVSCELTGSCVASSLALYGSSGGYSYLIPGVDTCSKTSEEFGTKISLEASIFKSRISAGETISCVPIMTMTDQELVKNLTKTVTICKDIGCEPDCKNIPDNGLYYPDRIYCNIYYQCDNGKPVVRPCGGDTYWEPSNCTCAHFDSSVCDLHTKKWIRLTTLKGCSY